MQSLMIHILITALVMVAVAVGCYVVEKNRKLRGAAWQWQVFLGILFGTLAIAAMAYGGVLRNNVDNIQDVAPLLAGLLFGAPAGILAGVLGAIGRPLLLPELGNHVCYAASLSLVVYVIQ